MNSFDKINRRLHLYLGLCLMPWLFMYGLSSLIIIHPSWFGVGKDRGWQPLFEKEYSRPVDAKSDLRATAEQILKDCNLEGAFWVNQPKPETLEIDRYSFWGSTRLTYSIKDQKLSAKHQRTGPAQAVQRMHFRGGYEQPNFWDKFWGLLVDLTCVAIVIWIGSGLIMWWRLPRLRAWGALAFGAGALLFAALVWTI